MSKRGLLLASLSVFTAILSLAGLSYGAQGQFAQRSLDGAGVVVDRMAEQAPLQGELAGMTLPAGALYASASKPGLFGDLRGTVGSQNQTKEWEARTLRTLGLAEIAFGLGTATAGALLISDSAIGIVPAIIGVFVAYLGYTDLSASRRFFYPDPLLSKDSMQKELLSGTESDHQGAPVLSLAMQVNF